MSATCVHGEQREELDGEQKYTRQREVVHFWMGCHALRQILRETLQRLGAVVNNMAMQVRVSFDDWCLHASSL